MRGLGIFISLLLAIGLVLVFDSPFLQGRLRAWVVGMTLFLIVAYALPETFAVRSKGSVRPYDLPSEGVVVRIEGNRLCVEAGGSVWQARLLNGGAVEPGTLVRVLGRNGMTLDVERTV